MKRIILGLIILCASLQAQKLDLPKDKSKIHVFLLMGQSNMSGFAGILEEDRLAVPGVYLLPTKGELSWKAAAHPLHNRLKSDRFGMGLPFAKEYMKNHPGITLGLIPVAWGGAGIDRLKKGSTTYADAIKKAKFSSDYGLIKGVLWHQGESDTVNPRLTDSYEVKLHTLIADLRNDLNNPQLPFIVGNLAEFYGTSKEHSALERVARIDQIRAVLRKLPSKVKRGGFVESSDCTSPDYHMVHFDRKSYILLGKRYASVYEKVIQNENLFTSLTTGKLEDNWIKGGDYKLEKGVISGGKGHLYSKKEYVDFHLKFDFKLKPGGNNGLAIRTPLKAKPIELQILDSEHPKYAKLEKYQYHGSLYNYVPAKRGFLKKAGEWNSQEVICKGSKVKVILNGTVIMEADLATVKPLGKKYVVNYINKAEKGHIGFLGHNSRVDFKNIKVKEL